MSTTVEQAWAIDPASDLVVVVRLVHEDGGTRTTLALLAADGWRASRTAPTGSGAEAGDAATLWEAGSTGHLAKSAWDLRWGTTSPVRIGRLAARLGVGTRLDASPQLAVSGTVVHKGRTVELDGAPGGWLRVRADAPGWEVLCAPGLARPDGSSAPLWGLTARPRGRREVSLLHGGGRPRPRIVVAAGRPEEEPAEAAGQPGTHCYNDPMAQVRVHDRHGERVGPGVLLRAERREEAAG